MAMLKLTFDEILLWYVESLKDYIHPPGKQFIFDRAQACIGQTLHVCKTCAAPSSVMHIYATHMITLLVVIFSYNLGSGYDVYLP